MGLQGSESSQFKFFWVTKLEPDQEPDQVPNLLSFPVRISYSSSLQLGTPDPVLLLLRCTAFTELRPPQIGPRSPNLFGTSWFCNICVLVHDSFLNEYIIYQNTTQDKIYLCFSESSLGSNKEVFPFPEDFFYFQNHQKKKKKVSELG